MKALIQKIKRLLRDRRFRRLWSRTISVVAALVVFVTTYALVLPAITMEREAYCGIPAHQHTDACFEQRLICTTPESPGHHHDDACYATHQELVCQVEEHTHDPTVCYGEEGTLVCQLPEHVHDQMTCRKDVTELTCTTEESDGHRHSDACYENVLVCSMEVHTHSEDCYYNPDEDVEANAVAAMQDGGDGTGAETPDEGAVFETYGDFVDDADYTIDPNGEGGLPADDGTGIPNDDAFSNEEGLPEWEGLPPDEEMDGMTAGQEMEGGEGGMAADEEGTITGEDGTPGQGTDGNPDAALDASGDENGNPIEGSDTAADPNALDPNAPQETVDGAQGATGGQLDPVADTYVPNLAPIDIDGVLNKRTGIYYYAVQEGETVEDSSSISGWKKIEKNTELGPNDLLRVYLSYTIPAGSLNKTNPTAVYRLPANLRLTDAQVNAINAVENGIAAQYIDYNTLTLTDPDNYHRYLGAEAIEGTRKPDQDLNGYLKEQAASGGTEQEFISATVRVENNYGTESGSGAGDGSAIPGQKLIFTFSPYTIEKNQHTYDASGQPTGAGEKVRGWFTLDFNLGQVNLGEPRVEEVADAGTGTGAAKSVNAADGAADEADTADAAVEMATVKVRVIRNAEIVFVQEDRTRGLEEISTQITVVTEEEAVNTIENQEDINDHPAEMEEADENHENDEIIEETAEGEENGQPTEETGAEDKDTEKADPEADKEKPEENTGGKNLNSETTGQDREKTDAEKEAELKEALASMMPAMSFEDSIRVRTGNPAGVVEGDAGAAAATAAEALPRKAKVTVRVEADEGTFPVGTTMVLSAVEDLDAVAETVRDAVENGGNSDASGNSVPGNEAATDAGSDHTTGNAEKTNTANAASAANNPKTYGFQAVDISFRDAEGNEIEPAKPVRVALTSEIVEQIKKDKETDETTPIADPVVVHVDDNGNAEKMDLIAPEEIEPAQGRTEEEIREELEKAAATSVEEKAAAEESAAVEKTSDEDNEKSIEAVDAVRRIDKAPVEPAEQTEDHVSAENINPDEDVTDHTDAQGTEDESEPADHTVFFETESFSVYAIVYTVDFHYEVNGRTYEFSIPGGGFASLAHIVDVMGVADSYMNPEMSTDKGITADSKYEESIILNSMPVSEASKQLVADIENVEFSSPALMWVGKTNAPATVGSLKEDNGLAVQYSADLTEAQIAEINAQTVQAGDWALISMQPFRSTETLRITMVTGESFEVQVTDAQISTHVITADGQDYIVTVTYGPEAGIPDGATLEVREIDRQDGEYDNYFQKSMAKAAGADFDDAVSVNEDFVTEAPESLMEETETTGAGGAAEETAGEGTYPHTDAGAEAEDVQGTGTKTFTAKAAEPYRAEDAGFARFFDIEILADGRKVEPEAEVSVTISLANVPQDLPSDLQVIHFGQDGVEVMNAVERTRVKDEASFTDLSFAADGFSVYSIVSTASGAIDNILNKNYVLVCNGVAVSPEQNTTYGYTDNLRGIPVTVNGNTISTTEDSLPVWQIHRYWNPHANQYYYQLATTVNGTTQYLHISNMNRGRTYVDGTVQDLRIEIRDNGTRYRFYRNDSGQSLDLFDNNYTRGFGTYDGWRDYEAFTLYELGEEIRNEVTVHFVDRSGNPLPGVTYNGSNPDYVTPKGNGVFEIPYDWKGTTGSVDVKADFSLNGYTYANTHLAKNTTETGWNAENYNQNGIAIDSAFTSNGNSLSFKSYQGYDSYGTGAGHENLETHNFNNAFYTWTYPYPTTGAVTTMYAQAGNKDVYVVLDPIPGTNNGGSGSGSGSGGSGSSGQSTENDPNFRKKLVPNGDGTYTLSLSVTGHALNNTEYPKANVLLVVDTSSSMVGNSGYNGGTRFSETKECLEDFAGKLFAMNGNGQEGNPPADTVEVAMFSFDGTTHDLTDTWMKTESEFNTALGLLRTHKGTNWEDALQKAYTVAQDKMNADHDPTFVIFFTDGEPSQYTNFHQSQPNDPSSTSGWKYFHPFLSRETAKDEAREIVNSGLRFYSVFAYGQNTPLYNGESCTALLHNLVKYGYNTTSDLTNKYFFDARNANNMTSAFTAILHAISNTLGISDVSMNDSITSLTSVGISMNGNQAEGFKYTRSGGRYGSGQTWEEAPNATYDNTGVHWDLGSQNTLEDGVTYTVSFTVWPSQQAYDYVTKLNDGFIRMEDIPAQDRSCFIFNESTGKYEVITNPPSGPKDDGSGDIVNATTYTKTETETVTALPNGVTAGQTYVVEPGQEDWPRVRTTTTYTDNGNGTWTKTVVTEVTSAFNPPDKNMTLENSAFNVEKIWQVGDRPEEMVTFLYDLTTGRPIEAHKTITFIINQIDNPSTPESFARIDLGYDEELRDFKWADATSPVTIQGITYQVGTTWRDGLDISFGLMLSPANADTRGLYTGDERYIPVYASEESARTGGTVLYYVLETGHDYLIDEPTLDYRFDFETEVYHPMLVDGQPQDVKVRYMTVGGKQVGILEVSGEHLSAMQGRNVLRGELDMSKTVLDPAGNNDTDNNEVFDFIVTLENTAEPGPFYNGTRIKTDEHGDPVLDENHEPVLEADPDEQNIPWYGVRKPGDDKVYFYHRTQPLENGDVDYVDELTACVGGNYINGLLEGFEGNVMRQAPEGNRNKVTAEIKINARETWTITNIPGGTTYTITEVPMEGYSFVEAEELNSSPSNVVVQPADPEISGIVHSNHKTVVEFTNQRLLQIEILKVDVRNLNDDEPEPLPGAAFTLEKYESAEFRWGLDTSWGTRGQKTAAETEENPGRFSFTGLTVGYYKLNETAYPDGYVKTGDDPIFQVICNNANEYEIVLLKKETNGSIVPVPNNQSDTMVIDNTGREIKLITYGNTPGAALPNSGGPGTLRIYLTGLLLTALAGLCLWIRREYGGIQQE